MTCPICEDSSLKESFQVKEMMLGIRDYHTYLLCNGCGCLYLDTPPSDMERYYPADYYSFNRSTKKMSFLKRTFSALRDRGVMLNTPWRLLSLLKPTSNIIRMVSLSQPKKDTAILDVGSGSGTKLEPIVNAGFRVVGIDPFIEGDVVSDRLEVRKKALSEVREKYDLIMFNHVFEHVDNPLDTLRIVSDHLNPHGKCMLRIPILPNAMWEKYKEHWIQIDAPRHSFIHSKTSISILAKEAGFRINRIVYDSTPFQMMGSELYSRGITMKEGDFDLTGNKQFSREEIEYFKMETKLLNREGRGDQAAIYLEKLD